MMKLADYIFERIEKTGVQHTFGIPGDFVLPLYAAQTRTNLKTVVLTHEPSVGYAADAYARLRGLGVALVTYGAGGLNMVNPVGLAYAEESPLLVISGAPETRFRNDKPQLHHCVKNFNTQHDVYVQVTEATSIVDNIKTAQAEIDRVFDTTLNSSRPGYIELPRDMVNQELELSAARLPELPAVNPALNVAVNEIANMLKAAKQPVLMVGVEVRRFGLKDKVIGFAEALNLPVVTSILGKATFPETHPNFIGNYFGQFGNPKVKDYVEGSDCVIALGAVMTEMESGGYTAKLSPENLVQINNHEVMVGYHHYNGLKLDQVLDLLLETTTAKLKPTSRFTVPAIAKEVIEAPAGSKNLTVAAMISALNEVLENSNDFSVVTDTGDCMYAGMSLQTDIFLAPGYYVSMGFGVPAAIGAQLAMPSRRPIVLVGDGAFQMTGMEISTAVKMGLNPIVIVFNNASYAMLRFIDQQRDYFDLPRWDYIELAKAVGGNGMQATSAADFKKALSAAQKSDKMFLIDAVIESDDISPTLRRLTDHFSKKVKAAIS
ncbi:thiamine pyrophosphate-binding protein [bacterium]|nr:thiamine pyrophosphate-binding protein [bacterium]MBP9808391.1 thiamine pyrophosphate-binding protein [bacterium]